MAIYNFSSDFAVRPEHQQNIPVGLREIPSLRQTANTDSVHNPPVAASAQAYPYRVEEFITPGFRALDEAMKLYWSGIRVPTKDSYRFMRVKIAGGEKSLLMWADELYEGRVRLPVAAINRSDHKFNEQKFSPPIHAMAARYLGRRRNLAAKVFRPVPYLVDYGVSIWAERKRDAEHILYQILTRFNPIAEFRMFDGHIQGNVQLRYGGCSDASEKEVGYDQHANVRYELNMTAEAWLPLPERITPTVLGQVKTVSESFPNILIASRSAAVLPTQMWFEPIQS